MTLDLWEKSTEDVRERWRDIARTLRDAGDAEAVPRALQTCFWFGAEASRAGASAQSEMTLQTLLPADMLQRLRSLGARPTSSPSEPRRGRP